MHTEKIQRPSWQKNSILLLASFLCGLVAAMLTGCTTPGHGMRMFWEEPPDTAEGVIAPYQRIEELKKLQQNQKKASMQEKQAISSRIASEYQKEEDPMIRCQMLKTLGVYPTESSANILRNAVKDSSPQVRMVACEAWGSRADQEAVQRLGECVRFDNDNQVRLAALRALADTGRADAVQSIAPALEDADPALQRRAVLALKEVSHEDFGNDVVRWQQWANNRPVDPPQKMSIAERIRSFF